MDHSGYLLLIMMSLNYTIIIFISSKMVDFTFSETLIIAYDPYNLLVSFNLYHDTMLIGSFWIFVMSPQLYHYYIHFLKNGRLHLMLQLVKL